jgi:deoxyribose-phosphate aldolase
LDTKELDKLVEQIGEEILTRLRPLQSALREVTTLPVPRPAGQWDRALAAMIDHTVLKADATRDEIVKLCEEARQYGFASVCVNGCWVPLAAKQLEGSTVKVCTVIGFPLGAAATDAKRAEAETAIRVGAKEVDMVLNIGALKSGDADSVKLDIVAVAEVAHRNGAIVKVILETALLDEQQKVSGCTLAKLASADFVKTSTGFADRKSVV